MLGNLFNEAVILPSRHHLWTQKELVGTTVLIVCIESLFWAFTMHIHGLFILLDSIQLRSCNKMCKISEIQSLKKWRKTICCFHLQLAAVGVTNVDAFVVGMKC